MTDKCAWFIQLDDAALQAAQAAQPLQRLGLAVQGQRWPSDGAGWLASAEAAAAAGAALVVVVGTAARVADSAIRRQLALFRLSLQTRLGRPVNGFTRTDSAGDSGRGGAGAGDAATGPVPAGILDDWMADATGSAWPAKAVARAYAPVAPAWPVRLELHALEQLGLWLAVHPEPTGTAAGALVGAAGNGARIDFHAVGPAGGPPQRSINQFELKDLQFEVGDQAFHAWGLRNPIPPDGRYYVRLEGEPDALAIGTLPDGEPDGVYRIRLA